MKKLMIALVLMVGSYAAMAQDLTGYGADFKTKKSVSVTEFKAKMDQKDNWDGVVTGTVKEVCKKEGCWLRLDDGSASGIMVKMKDHAFVLPKDIDGRTVYVSGKATKKTTSVDELKHYAEDAGKSKAEIDAITQPKVEVSIEAAGVKVAKN